MALYTAFISIIKLKKGSIIRYSVTYPYIVILLVGLLLLPDTQSFAQDSLEVRPTQLQVELGGYAAINHTTPFWLRANQWGIVPLHSPLVTGNVHYSLDYKKKHVVENDSIKIRQFFFSWGIGVNPVFNLGRTNQIVLPEAYLKLKLGSFELYSGRWKQLLGVGDSTLTSGFAIMSGNAIPIPKVQLGTRGYVPLKFLKSFLAFNVGYSHGWFLNTYIQNSYLHQKYAYLRIGKPSATVKMYIGINHQVQWGGYADYLNGSQLAVNGKLPSSFNDYINIVLAKRPKEFKTATYTDFDGSYRIGNHVGGNDLGLEITKKNSRLLAYYQHPLALLHGS